MLLDQIPAIIFFSELSTTSEHRVQKKRAAELKAEWGDRPCEHARISKEYDLGAHTGAYVCNTCGKPISLEEKRALRNRGKAGS